MHRLHVVRRETETAPVKRTRAPGRRAPAVAILADGKQASRHIVAVARSRRYLAIAQEDAAESWAEISLRARPLPAPQQTNLQLTACEFSAERNRELLPSCGPASHTASGLLNLPTALTTRFRQAGSASNLLERCRSAKTCLMRNLGPCHSGSSAALYPLAKIGQAKSSIKFIRMSLLFETARFHRSRPVFSDCRLSNCFFTCHFWQDEGLLVVAFRR